jgi:N6-adenosine-specific RNA methylase IME4
MTFKTVLLDPPYPEQGGGKIKRGADRHYPLVGTPGNQTKTAAAMKTVIESCPHWRDIEEDAHMFMWVTSNYLVAGLNIIGQLGFTFKRDFVWVKTKAEVGSRSAVEVDAVDKRYLQPDEDPNELDLRADDLAFGIGQYARGAHELLLFATRGEGYAVRTDAKNIRSVLCAPVSVHSRKPPESYELVEARSHGPYLEMFARTERPGWTSWGNEI